jgi:hypothetical protein
MAKAIREILIDLAISYRESDASALRHNNGMVKSVEGVYRSGKVELWSRWPGRKVHE